MTLSPPPADDDMSDETRVSEIRARLEAAAPGPWSWSKTYELAGDEGIVRHWCLHNPLSESLGQTINGWLVLGTTSATNFDGVPLDKTPDFEFIASSRSDIDWLLSRVEALEAEKSEAKRAAFATGAHWFFGHDDVPARLGYVLDGTEAAANAMYPASRTPVAICAAALQSLEPGDETETGERTHG